MIHDNIIAAPQTSSLSTAYVSWHAHHAGTMADFLIFITSPSIQRTQFLAGLNANRTFDEGIAVTDYQV